MPVAELLVTTLGPPVVTWLLDNFRKGAVSGKKTSTLLVDQIHRINERFEDQVKVFGELTSEPTVVIEGELELTPAQRDRRLTIIDELSAQGRTNDPHAILSSRPLLDADPVVLSVRTTDFGGVLALREEGERPEILSSSAVLVCKESGQLVLHRRSEAVHTYPGYIHTLGGAYMPPVGAADPDRLGLSSTVEREIHEESQLVVSAALSHSLMLSKELDTGFIQLVFLGLELPATMLDRLSGNWEGSVVRVPFADLPSLLLRDDWVPSGKAHVLAWLAAGAPGAGKKPMFGSLTASQLLAAHLGS